ncbi:unnamed protein product [Periconia digitata]|uniref:Rhodopsin domain-containing protein n=1 Tax=Periconia digitata TaxID=1303443 RepID=A0A9W4UGK4_9PLEO|nr:unnamed protein product [Periconia digitata]
MVAEQVNPDPTGLPEGVSKPLLSINSQDQSGLIAILTAFALGLVLLSVAARLYARHEFRLFRIDDYLFIAATIFAVIQTALVFRQLRDGLGKSEEQIDPSVRLAVQKLGFAADLLYLFTLFLSKCSVSFLFLYLTPGRAHVRAIWTTITASVVWVITAVILEAVRCHPKHPWTDDTSTCTNFFARWVVIAVLDAIIELALVGVSIYIVSDLQMALKSKLIVVGAFSWRVPNIAFTFIRLAFLQYPFEPSTSHIWHSRVVTVTQLSIGYTITASVIPYLKPFMMAYDPPTKTQASSYQLSSSGTRVKLSNLASQHSATLATIDDGKDDGELRENRSRSVRQNKPKAERRRRSTPKLGRLRPGQNGYEVSASATEQREQDRHEHESDDSEQMIIKKGVEWSVTYQSNGRKSRERRSSAAATEESRGATPGPDDITAVKTHV